MTCFLAIGAFASALAASEPRCDSLKGAPAERLREFLTQRTPDDRSDPLCTEYALWTLGGNRDAASIPLFFKYITFKREPDDLEQFGAVHRIGPEYPAVDALAALGPGRGEPEPEIIGAFRDYLSGPLTDLQRANAVEAFAGYYRGRQPAAVRYLAEQSKKLKGTPAEALRSAAELLAKRCSQKSRDACLQELER
jgi:hypothetical protein